jgi:hypothetical protein
VGVIVSRCDADLLEWEVIDGCDDDRCDDDRCDDDDEDDDDDDAEVGDWAPRSLSDDVDSPQSGIVSVARSGDTTPSARVGVCGDSSSEVSVV